MILTVNGTDKDEMVMVVALMMRRMVMVLMRMRIVMARMTMKMVMMVLMRMF